MRYQSSWRQLANGATVQRACEARWVSDTPFQVTLATGPSPAITVTNRRRLLLLAMVSGTVTELPEVPLTIADPESNWTREPELDAVLNIKSPDPPAPVPLLAS